MKQAFVLPFPKTIRVPEPDLQETVNLPFWKTALDRLAEKKWSWEQFLRGIPLFQHPCLRLVTSKENNTLLHLAVLFNRIDLVRELSADPQLKLLRNASGLTPLELAQFLHHKEMERMLCPSSQLLFSHPSQLLLSDPAAASHIEFLPHPVFENEEIFEDVLFRAKKAKEEDFIPSERIWMGIYFDNEIQKGLHPLISIRYINSEIGYGAFAEQRIPPCAFVGEYTGIIKKRKKKQLKGEIYSIRYSIWGMDKKRYIIDGKSKGNFTRFINHSAKPNLSLQSVYWRGIPRMIFVALKEIREGTQLTFDYGQLFWKECKQNPQVL